MQATAWDDKSLRKVGWSSGSFLQPVPPMSGVKGG